jgi:oligogalacturonide lyase
MRTVIDVPFRLGHLQTNPWVPGEILYCHETTGDAPQRMWVVRADGTGNRPALRESPDEWVTHETFSGKDEVMFDLMGHLPYLRERPTGVAVVNLRTNQMTILGQIDEDMDGGGTGGFWHANGSPDGTVGGGRFLPGQRLPHRSALAASASSSPPITRCFPTMRTRSSVPTASAS